MNPNLDVHNICTPVNPDSFKRHLMGYDPVEKEFVLRGFRDGFKLHFQGNRKQQIKSDNMPLTLQRPEVVWEKIMKEVNAGRVVGPFSKPPFEHYICSPLGLVPKAGQEGQFRLIFNLSKENPISVNGEMPQRYKVTFYQDFDLAVEIVQQIGPAAKLGKADLAAAFRQTLIVPEDWPLLVFKAVNPHTQQTCYFFVKCLPFGSGESCQIYQRISNALAWVTTRYTQKALVNYIDDFLFTDRATEFCDAQIRVFLDICADVGFPVSDDKTEWSEEFKVFLG